MSLQLSQLKGCRAPHVLACKGSHVQVLSQARSGPRRNRLAPRQSSMTATARIEPSTDVVELWRTAQAVCFDVDSTFCADESIDEIAAFLGVGEQVAAMTAQAMGGSVRFEDALAARLNVMGLSQQKLDEFLQVHPAQLTPGIPELVKKLQSQGKAVFLVSGGFRQVIHPIAEALAIPISNVYANQLLFKVSSQQHTVNGSL
eukprot:GHUV01041217.1.p1 GENE.GHUV01041217.1~~GHUV01041217.1.p1  ORF type:complete len:202 (+),score=36.16 GHUV01041217.1:68-673(+)